MFIYSKDDSELLQRKVGIRFDGLKMILSGDFNINFPDDNNLPLIEFLSNKFQLTMSNDRHLSTTRYKTSIDAVFTWYFHRFDQSCSIPTLVTLSLLYQFLNLMTNELLKLLMNNNTSNVELIKFYKIGMNLK